VYRQFLAGSFEVFLRATIYEIEITRFAPDPIIERYAGGTSEAGPVTWGVWMRRH